jgi:sterol desaturase/sphingolipid hydroxylase (fatty acid hydroxylase superfamily)
MINYFLGVAAGTGLSILFLALIFIPMEKAFPAKNGQTIFRRHWSVDLFFLLGQYFFWGFVVLVALNYVGVWLTAWVPQSFRDFIAAQPLWLLICEAILLSDFLIYWGHRFQHKNNFLWRFHKVHHTAKDLDWLAAYREHPIDTIYTMTLINLPMFVVGIPLEILAGLVAFRGIWAIYIHSNVRFPLGPLQLLIGSPELHHWHHDLARDRGNYGNLSPLMDVIFGTHTCPAYEPAEFGIAEEFPAGYWGQLICPVVPGFVWKKIKKYFK